jgi:hypothetical protein
MDTIVEYGLASSKRYSPGGVDPSPEMIEAFKAQAPKRVVIDFTPVHTVSWDHRKLGSGVY